MPITWSRLAGMHYSVRDENVGDEEEDMKRRNNTYIVPVSAGMWTPGHVEL
jgi:hypothetical protein